MKKTESKSIKVKESPFNSKLFFDLDTTSNDTKSNESESDNSFDSEEIELNNNNDYFLLKELIKEIDSSCYEKEETTKNILNDSYYNKNNIYYPNNNSFNEFCPFSFIYQNNDINGEIKDNTYIKKGKNFHQRRGDWNCFFCTNLNFSFRTTCNRCKASKDETIKRLNELFKKFI